ncbi:type II toxin-antitoxin system VapC family toxin [Saccharopolyspora sp. 5N708]|uniref:type II toxin-antitoxin system VapC family toxin n=1 Tax=Saccharopolyspora sp. 5N708 TaxID=3457424 RepID=UPI003FD4E445
MTVFADSSAVVKLYLDEPGHQDVRRLNGLVISELARVEVPAALWKKRRMRVLTHEQAGYLITEFEADYYGAVDEPGPRFSVVSVRPAVLDHAAHLTATFGLRAYDAIQLATAVLARAAEPRIATFAAYDKQLCAAAVSEGFAMAVRGV